MGRQIEELFIGGSEKPRSVHRADRNRCICAAISVGRPDFAFVQETFKASGGFPYLPLAALSAPGTTGVHTPDAIFFINNKKGHP